MEGYESIFITDPDLSEEVQAGVLDKIKKTVTQTGGEVEQYHLWGRRRLAYLINKKSHGNYHLMYLTGGEEMLKELAQQYRFTEEIIRFQTVKVMDIQKESENFLELCQQESQPKTAPVSATPKPETKETKPPNTEATKTPNIEATTEAPRADDEASPSSEAQAEPNNAPEVTSGEGEEN